MAKFLLCLSLSLAPSQDNTQKAVYDKRAQLDAPPLLGRFFTIFLWLVGRVGCAVDEWEVCGGCKTMANGSSWRPGVFLSVIVKCDPGAR
uniref:Putative secreted protein n=1 Tax=Anopheles marajoara TaxID=58244 RepID=A0A2M4C9V6_9DIPT